MARVAGVNIPDKKQAWISLTHIFGIGRTTYDAAQEVRNEKITRNEAIALVKKFDHEFPEKYFEDFLAYINIDKDLFFKTIDHFRSPHLWEKKGSDWILKQKVY